MIDFRLAASRPSSWGRFLTCLFSPAGFQPASSLRQVGNLPHEEGPDSLSLEYQSARVEASRKHFPAPKPTGKPTADGRQPIAVTGGARPRCLARAGRTILRA